MQENINDEDGVQTVGEILRNARIRQGKNLRIIGEELCIRTSYLEAIENMDLKNIPEPPYGIGFIRSYAEYLGLNGERIVSSYKQTVYGVTEQNKQITEKKSNTSKPKIYHIIWGFIGLAAIAYAWFEWPLYRENETVEPFENSENVTDIPQPLIIDTTNFVAPKNIAEVPVNNETQLYETEVDGLTLTEEIAKIASAEQSDDAATELEQTDGAAVAENKAPEIKMVVVGPSWVELRVNGETVLSKTLQKGFEYTIEDAEHTTVTAGRHYNVKFYVDGQEVKILSARQNKNVTLNKLLKKEN